MSVAEKRRFDDHATSGSSIQRPAHAGSGRGCSCLGRLACSRQPTRDSPRGREGSVCQTAKSKAIAAEELPSEIAADAKAADIAEELKFLPGRQLVPHAQANEGIDPFKGTGSRDGARTRPLEAEVAKVDRGIDREREIEFLIPIPSAAEHIEGRRRTWSTPFCDLIGETALGHRRLVVQSRIGAGLHFQFGDGITLGHRARPKNRTCPKRRRRKCPMLPFGPQRSPSRRQATPIPRRNCRSRKYPKTKNRCRLCDRAP